MAHRFPLEANTRHRPRLSAPQSDLLRHVIGEHGTLLTCDYRARTVTVLVRLSNFTTTISSKVLLRKMNKVANEETCLCCVRPRTLIHPPGKGYCKYVFALMADQCVQSFCSKVV